MNTPVIFLKKIVRVRKKLISINQSKINHFHATKILNELELYLDAYGKTLGEDFWRKFIKKRAQDILFIIPASKAGDKYTKELNNIISNE